MDSRAIKQVGGATGAGDLGVIIMGKLTGGTYGPLPIAADGLSLATTPSTAGTMESGTDSVGQNAYATVITPTAAKKHLMIINEGPNAAIVSIDGGVTDTIAKMPGGFVTSLDDVSITTAAIQAKNFLAGANYTLLTVYVW